VLDLKLLSGFSGMKPLTCIGRILAPNHATNFILRENSRNVLITKIWLVTSSNTKPFHRNHDHRC
jgi:hypothetical protein